MASAAITCDGSGAADSARDEFARLLRRIRSEFLEMPGMRLTLPQAQRLWGLDAGTCAAALRHLLETQFLTADGVHFARPTHGPGRGRMAKASPHHEMDVHAPLARR